MCNVTATGRSQDPYWYTDCAASSHITHDISAFLSTDLDDNTEEILAADGVVLRTRGSGTIALATSVNGNDSFIHLHNVHYCPEIDTNLLSLGALEAKRLRFSAENSMLEVRDFDGKTVFQAKRRNNVYPLLQPTPQEYHHRSREKAYYMTKATPATRERWHERTGHANYKNLQSLLRLVDGVPFSDSKTDPLFCDACVLGKHHRCKGPTFSMYDTKIT